MTKIKFRDGSVGELEVKHRFEGWQQHIIKVLVIEKQMITETIAALETLGHLSEGARCPALIKFFKERLQNIKGDIKLAGKRPIKTEVEFTYNGQTTKAHAKISQYDADRNLHSREVGRKAAFRNLIRELGERDENGRYVHQPIISRNLRGELARKLGLTK